MGKKQSEYAFQKQLCGYINTQYKDVLYLSDTIASVKLSFPQQQRNKAVQKKGFKCPDLIILEPTAKYKGLFLELKIESPYYVNDPTRLKANEHIEQQAKSMELLRKKGYFCTFVWDFDTAKQIIDKYLKNEL